MLEHNSEHTLRNVHPASSCAGEVCSVHNRTDHVMRAFPQMFRPDNGLMERTCPHGIGHPDPDALPFFERQGITHMGIHGCDGCCGGNE